MLNEERELLYGGHIWNSVQNNVGGGGEDGGGGGERHVLEMPC